MPRAFKLFAAHMRMFIRDTSDTALTLGCTIVAMALCLASMIFQLSWRFPEGCAIQAAYYKIGAPKQCNLPLRIINATHVLRFVVTSSGMIWTWAKLVFKLMRPCSFWEQHGADEVSWAAAWKERGVGGTATPGWTVAASRQVVPAVQSPSLYCTHPPFSALLHPGESRASWCPACLIDLVDLPPLLRRQLET